MEWNRSETFGLSRPACQLCGGTGARIYKEKEDACPCVFRAIFRACYKRFTECAGSSDAGKMSASYGISLDRSASWSRKNEEYAADFLLIMRRTLAEEEQQIFRFRYMLGADWKLCCRRLKVDKGNYFHALYRIQAKLGRVFRELEPYPLFPVNEYFAVSTHMSLKRTPRVIPMPTRRSLSESVPLKEAA